MKHDVLKFQVVVEEGRKEVWLPIDEAKQTVQNPDLHAAIGGYVLGAVGSAREILPSEVELLRREDSTTELTAT